MSSNYIGLGLTVDQSRLPSTYGEATDRIIPFLPQIVKKIERIDPQEYFSNTGEGVLDTFVLGVLWLVDGDHNTWQIPGTEFHFVTAGGESWGDSPFEEYDAVIHIAAAAEIIPGFAEALGVVGGGITVSYPA